MKGEIYTFLLKNRLQTVRRFWGLVGICIILLPSLLITRGNGYAKYSEQSLNFPTPVFAYYYIWYEPTSWNRAKIDYPLIGRYSSDDLSVMRQHVSWAKQSGIQGFIVSWKSTERLNRRLEQLIKIAEEENFKLMIIYQGLTFERQPRPMDQVADDFDLFIKIYSPSPVFQIFNKPLLIWNGTTQYSLEDIAFITQNRRDSLFILATEKNKDAYLRVANLVDGNAYYWSSANPRTYSGYQEKLNVMGRAIHENEGIWIPSVSPGFDARLVGGERVVDREDGEMFRLQMDAAFNASADVIGIASWNEFSENTHIEPSETFQMHYLDVLKEILNVPPPTFPEFDSSDPVKITDQEVSQGEKSTSNNEFIRTILRRIGSLVYLLGIFIASSFILIVRRLLEK